MSGLERRPGNGLQAAFPDEWIKRFGRPPADPAERALWVRRAIRDGLRRRDRGERVAWLARRSGR